MKLLRAMVFALAALTAAGPASADPGSGLAGYWWNLNPPTGSLAHIVVTPYTGGFGMQIWVYSGGTFYPWGEFPAQLPALGTMMTSFTDKVPATRQIV